MSYKSLLTFTFLLLLITSCSSDDDMINTITNSKKTFQLTASHFEGESLSTRGGEGSTFQRVYHYIIDLQSNIVTDIESGYLPNSSSVFVENLKDGDYFLIVLADKATVEDTSIEVHKLSSATDKWLSVDPTKNTPFDYEILYAKHPFSVQGGVVSDQNVALKKILARIDFNIVFGGEYTKRLVESITLIPDTQLFTNTFHADNRYTNPTSSINAISLDDSKSIMLFPKMNLANFNGKLKIVWKSDGNSNPFEQYYSFSTQISPNKLSQVRIKVVHPRDDIGTVLIRDNTHFDDLNESNFFQILQDDESKTIYENQDMRSFRINQPLQVRINESQQMHLRFYSAISMKNVSIYGKIDGIKEEIEVARFEYLPSFADVTIPITITQRDAIYATITGGYVEITKKEALSNDNIQFKIVCDDEYWQKIEQIRAKWYIYFSSYGANPELENGGIAGNWKGIRPVHTREAVAMITNTAYMLQMKEFEDYVAAYIAKGNYFYGNGGATDTLDSRKIIPAYEARPGFKVGVVTNGYTGLGGGWTLGMANSRYLYHYDNQGAIGTFFHEVAHCIGWSHSSSMTYGNWSNVVANVFYINNIQHLPVNSHTYLNSRNNPNKYPGD